MKEGGGGAGVLVCEEAPLCSSMRKLSYLICMRHSVQVHVSVFGIG